MFFFLTKLRNSLILATEKVKDLFFWIKTSEFRRRILMPEISFSETSKVKQISAHSSATKAGIMITFTLPGWMARDHGLVVGSFLGLYPAEGQKGVFVIRAESGAATESAEEGYLQSGHRKMAAEVARQTAAAAEAAKKAS